MTDLSEITPNRKTVFLRYVENMLLSRRILNVDDVRNYRNTFAPELLVLLDAYAKDLYFDDNEELIAMFSHWSYQ